MPNKETAQDECRSEDEIARRRDAALLRALSTPHKRQAEMKVGKTKREPGEPSPRRMSHEKSNKRS